MLERTATDPVLSARRALALGRAAADVEAALASPAPPVARLAEIRHLLAEQLGYDMNARGWAATVLAFLFRHRPGPFTWALMRLTGETARVDPVGDPDGIERRVTGAEAVALGVLDEPGLWIWERSGLLMLGATVAAEVRLRVLPARLPEGWDGDAIAAIRKGQPCGLVIPDITRHDRAGAATWPGDPAALGGAVLHGGPDQVTFGLSGERVTRGLATRLAGLS